MTESLGDLLRHGFDTWKGNLNICLPFILRPVFVLMIGLLLALPFIAIFLIQSDLTVDDILSESHSEDLSDSMKGKEVFFVLAAILFSLLVIVIYSAFQAGAVSMAMEATERGETSSATMWASGKKHYVKMALSYALTGVIWIGAALIACLPFLGAMIAPGMSGLIFGLGFMFAFTVMFLVFLATALVPYALVIDDLGPVEAVSASITFFRENQLDVLPIPIMVFVISIAIGIIGWFIGLVGAESQYVSILWSFIEQILTQVVVASLAAVWWTRLYMSRTGKLNETMG